MPEFDKRAIIEAYREDIISLGEAREALGFDLAVYGESREVEDLREEVEQLDEVISKLKADVRFEKELAKAEYLRGYREGKRDGVLRPLWVNYRPTVTTSAGSTLKTLTPGV